MSTRVLLGISFFLAGALSACSATSTPTPGYDEGLVAIWVEARRVAEDGTSSVPDDPLHVGFFPDGTFKAVFESHRFETFHDFWGEWRADGGSLRLSITGGNNPPQQSAYEGRYEVQGDELVLEGIALVDAFSGPTMAFSHFGPAPEDQIVP
jgi:hypothetical protein